MTDEQIISDLNATVAPSPTPIDWDEVGRKYLDNALFQTRRSSFEAQCPLSYQKFDSALYEAEERLCQNRASFEKVLNWKVEKKGIIASGPTGGGKTLACWQLIRRLMIEELRDVAIYTAAEWFAKLQAHVNYGKDEAHGWVRAVAERPVVFIDDYGQEAVTTQREQWARSWFFTFLDMRRANGLPLLMTTNLNATQIAKSNGDLRGDPLLTRLLAVCDPVKFT